MSLKQASAVLVAISILLAVGCSQAAREPAVTAKSPETAGPPTGEEEAGLVKSGEEATRVHRLASTRRSAYDAFTYVNRLPEGPEEWETPIDVAGRIFGRLANQEGRILIKVPAGMDRQSYLGFKTFFRYEGEARVGNCAACHTLAEFTDEKEHVVTAGGSPVKTPSLRNLRQTKVDVASVIKQKIAASKQKRSGEADEIDDAYAVMNIREEDVAGLVAFLELLNDVPDEDFRNLILDVTLLDTSGDIE
ncbi:MAG: c-type cytochrome [Pirellulaceae bacterium]